MTATLAEMAKILPTLDKTQFSVLVRSILGIKDGRDVELRERLKMGLYEFLMALGFVTDVQARSILAKIDPIATIYARLFQEAEHSKMLPTFTVVIADKRFACWPDRDTWLDLTFDEDVETLAEPAVMLINCNVTALHLRMQGWLNQLRSSTDATERRHHGGPESGAAVPQHGVVGPSQEGAD